MTDATHTRESGYATTERLSRLKAWVCEMSAVCAQLYPDNVKMEQRWYDLQAATDAFEKSLSTPIPLTPSDEMVDAAALEIKRALGEAMNAKPLLGDETSGDWYSDGYAGSINLEDVARPALQAALNLMGGKK